jgi:hypothetical protein
MSTSDVGFKSFGDCCLTSVAVVILLGQGSWILAKRSAYEGMLTCKTGWEETHKSINHLCSVTTRQFECIAAILTRVLIEIEHLFLRLSQETFRAFISTGAVMDTAAECAGWLIAPLSEMKETCISGAHTTMKAVRSTWHGFESGIDLLESVTAPFGQEDVRRFCQGLGRVQGSAELYIRYPEREPMFLKLYLRVLQGN